VDENVSENLAEEYKTCVYRIVQEALDNCSKHAYAKNERVGQMGGVLKVESDPVRGPRLRIDLPLPNTSADSGELSGFVNYGYQSAMRKETLAGLPQLGLGFLNTKAARKNRAASCAFRLLQILWRHLVSVRHSRCDHQSINHDFLRAYLAKPIQECACEQPT
jgi:hypothetical protein